MQLSWRLTLGKGSNSYNEFDCIAESGIQQPADGLTQRNRQLFRRISKQLCKRNDGEE